MTIAMENSARMSSDSASFGVRRTGQALGIPVRRMGLSFDESIPIDWAGGNPLLTAYFAAFSAILPEGEAQFIYAVRLFKDKIKDPLLLAQVRAFVGQETHHAKEHRALNQALEKRGFPLAEIESRLKARNLWLRENHSPETQLAHAVCFEHITALMAEWALNEHPEVFDSAPPEVRTLWVWHAIEEIEHKAVVFDVYDQVVGDRDLLRRCMVRVTAMFVAFSTWNALKMLRPSARQMGWTKWREALDVLSTFLSSSSSEFLRFFERDFHPSQNDSRAVLAAAKRKYLGE